MQCKNVDDPLPIKVGENLLLILIIAVVNDVEEAELVNTLGGGDDTKPVTELVLLEELLGAKHR
jgi:hypothetical protein